MYTRIIQLGIKFFLPVTLLAYCTRATPTTHPFSPPSLLLAMG